jgi:hypothetical protein
MSTVSAKPKAEFVGEFVNKDGHSIDRFFKISYPEKGNRSARTVTVACTFRPGTRRSDADTFADIRNLLVE